MIYIKVFYDKRDKIANLKYPQNFFDSAQVGFVPTWAINLKKYFDSGN